MYNYLTCKTVPFTKCGALVKKGNNIMRTKKLYLILSEVITIVTSYSLLHLSLGSKNLKFVKNLVPSSTKQTIKKLIFT